MQKLFVILIAILVALPAFPQMAVFNSIEDARRALEIQENHPEGETREAARLRAAAYESHQFEVRLEEFAHAWNDFVREYSAKGTYNLKKAKSLSRALKKLQAQLPR